MWADNSGNLWVFAGMGSSFSSWNDLWRYVPPRSFSQSQINATACSPCNGSATINFSCALGNYSYVWSNGSATLNTTNNSNTISGLCPGTYTVTATSSCDQSQTATFVITGTSCNPCTLTGQFIKGAANCSSCGCKQWIMVNATGGTSPYIYTWSDGYTNRYNNALCPGTYNINIKDKNGCSVNMNLTVP
ncbi:MAG: hypothetical protein HYU69_14430 [Bacteroidetes bacterium]|nr:hypothetical protein [Bacteroidota bacterium]